MSKLKIFLLLSNIVLGCFIYLTYKSETTNFNDLDSLIMETMRTVEEIEIKSEESNESLRIQKKGEEWMLVSPVIWKAETLMISDLKTKLVHSDPVFVIDESELNERGEILSDYGIDENSKEIRLKGSDRNLRFTIGKETRDKTKIFIRISGVDEGANDGIWKAPKSILTVANSSPVYWSEGTFIDIPLYGIDEIVVSEFEDNNSKKSVIKKNNSQEWTINKSENKSVNYEQLTTTLNKILSYRIDGFIENSEIKKRKIKLDEPILTLFVNGLGNSEVIRFYEVKNHEFLICLKKGYDTPFIVEKEILDILSDWDEKFRSKRIFKHNFFDIKEIVVSTDKFKKSLKKSIDENWSIDYKNDNSIISYLGDRNEINNFILDLYDIRIEQLLDSEENTPLTEVRKLNEKEFNLLLTYENNQTIDVTIIEDNSPNNYYKSILHDNDRTAYLSIPSMSIFDTSIFKFKEKINSELITKSERIDISLQSDSNQTIIHSSKNNKDNNEIKTEFIVKKYLDTPYEETGVWVSGDWIPWKYKINFRDSNEDLHLALSLSSLKDSNTWIAGNADNNHTFILENEVSEWFRNKVLDSENQ